MSEQSGTDRLQYLRNPLLRERLCRFVGEDPGDRFRDDECAAMRKHVVVKIARVLGVEEPSELTLAELYVEIGDAVDEPYEGTAGCQYGLQRCVLKAVHRELSSAPSSWAGSREVVDA